MKNFLFISAFILSAFQFIFGQTNKVPDTPILNGLAEILPKPEFPQEAKDFCAKGIVSIKVVINEAGLVASSNVVAGDELLRDAALEAVKKAKFRKTTFGGVPIKVEGFIVYNFPLEGKCVDAGIVNKKTEILPKPYINPHIKIKRETIIKVRVVIDESGNVILAKSLTGHPLLRTAFENAARKAKFQPSFVGRIRVKGYLVYKVKPNGKVEI